LDVTKQQVDAIYPALPLGLPADTRPQAARCADRLGNLFALLLRRHTQPAETLPHSGRRSVPVPTRLPRLKRVD
jgi:hypothetical protein